MSKQDKYHLFNLLSSYSPKTETIKSIKAMSKQDKYHLSHDIAPGSDITLCNKIDKPLVVYRFSGNVITSIIMLRKRW